MKRLVLAAVAVVALAAPLAASAHPLGNFTINRYSELDVSGNRLYVVYVLDLAEIPTFQARGTRRRDVRPDDLSERAPERGREARAARARPSRARVPAGPGRPRHDAARGALRRAEAVGPAATRVSRRQLRGPARLEGDRRPRGQRRLDRPLERPRPQHQRRAARLPEEPPPEPARRHLRNRGGRSGRGCRAGAGAPEPVAAGAAGRRPGSRRLGIREADPPPAQRLVPGRRARNRVLLGCGACAQPRPRQVDHHGLPRGLAGNRPARIRARRDGDDHAYDRRLRPRARDPEPVAVHPPRAALPLAEPDLGAPDRRGRPLGAALARARMAAPGPARGPPSPRTTTTTGITTTTIPRSARAACSASASPAGSSRARRRSSCCSPRSRCTGSATASS